MNAETKVKAGGLSAALVRALAEIGAAIKDAENPAFKQGGKAIRYADINAVLDAIKPVLAANDLGMTQHPQPSNGGVTIETMLHHSGGESLSLGTLFVPANKQDAQGFGSALTYCRRYALMTAFGVPAEDDDGNAAVKAGADTSGAINEAQLATLQTYASGGVIDAARFCAFFQIGSLKDLPASRYDEAIRMAQAKAAKAKEVEPVQ
jgi:hypothetical protein